MAFEIMTGIWTQDTIDAGRQNAYNVISIDSNSSSDSECGNSGLLNDSDMRNVVEVLGWER